MDPWKVDDAKPEERSIAARLRAYERAAQDSLGVFSAFEEARRAVEREHVLLEAVLRQMPTGVLVAEAPSGRVLMTNERVDALLGPFSSRAAREDYRSWRCLHQDGQPYAPADFPLSRSLRLGEVVSGEDVRVLRADGHLRHLRVSSAPIRDSSGRTVAAIAILDDVTERRRIEEAQRFLGEASDLFSTSLDRDTTLRNLARLAVPHVAEGCRIDVVDEEGDLQVVEIVHVESSRVATLRGLPLRCEVGDRVLGPLEVVRTGRPQFVPDLPTDLRRAQSTPGLEALRAAALQSAILVPMVASGGRVVGVIALVTRQGGRALDVQDLAVAIELARRAGTAVDNARLYREIETAERHARFVAEASRVLVASLDHATTLRGVVHTLVPGFADWCVVELLQDGDLTPVAVAHADPELELALGLVHGDSAVQHGSSRLPGQKALLGGRAVLLPALDDRGDLLRRGQDPAELGLVGRVEARSAIVAPMAAHGQAVGVITVGSTRSGRYGQEDAWLLEELAQRAALAIDNARLYQREQEAQQRLSVALAHEQALVRHLAESFLGTVPAVPGLEVACLYEPAMKAERVGGDYYDFIPLSDGRIGLVIGDVCGKGLKAGIYTATTKYMLRAYATEEPEPAHVAQRLNRALYGEMAEEGMFVTLVYGILDLEAGTLTYCNAGHPAPVIYDGETDRTHRLEVTGGLLGAIPRLEFHQEEIALPQGGILALFTDGVTEASGELDPVGDGGVGDVLRKTFGRDARTVANAILRSATARSGGNQRDDIAIVVVRDARGGGQAGQALPQVAETAVASANNSPK